MRVLLHLAGVTVALIGLACKGDEEPSTLEQRAQAAPSAPATPSGEVAKDPGATVATPATGTGERVELRLALNEGTTYRVQAFGQVELPLVQGKTMFVREAVVDVTDCSGEGADRRCKLSHRYTNFEAQEPAGRFLQVDYNKIGEFKTSHHMTALGFRDGPTEVDGPGSKPELGEGLTESHAFMCLRFPREPVAKGAKWNDTCRAYARGQVGTREVMWELSEISDDPKHGKRAELTMIGKYREANTEGTIAGALYFYVDLGEPRAYRERISVTLDEAKGLRSVTDLKYVLAKAVPGGKDEFVQPAGEKFEGKALSSDPVTPEVSSEAKKKAPAGPTP